MLVDRRDFLKSLGLVGGATVVGCNPMAPEETMAAYLSPPREMVPGVAAYYATVCRACPAGCGILVKTRERRPIKLEGNPAHPVNRGALCARGQAYIQELYGRQRIQEPLVKKDGRLVKVPWSTALKEVAERIQINDGFSILTGLESGTFEILLEDLSEKFGNVRSLMYEPMALSSLATASRIVFGKSGVPRLDLSGVSHIVSLGADFLDTWLSPVELSRQWSKAHGVEGGRTLQMDYIGPRRNLTATAADRFTKIAPANIGWVAVAILQGVSQKIGRNLNEAEKEAIHKVLEGIGKPPARDAVPEQEINAMVARLLDAKKGLVLYGGAEVIGVQSTLIHSATLLTNHLLGSVGTAERYGDNHALSKASRERDVVEFLEIESAAKRDVLLIHGANPVYTLPRASGVRDALAEKRFVVSLAHQVDETTEIADVVLPVHHPLESWGDYWVTDKIGGLMQPVRSPLYNTRDVGDLLIELAGRAGKKLPHASYEKYLSSRWAGFALPSSPAMPVENNRDGGVEAEGSTHGAVDGNAGNFRIERWEEMLVQGGFFPETAPSNDKPIGLAKDFQGTKIDIASLPSQKGVTLISPFSVLLYDGRGSGLDWLREVPDPLSQTSWEVPLEIAPDVAEAKGLESGDLAEIKSEHGAFIVRVLVESGLARGVAALRPGGLRHLARYIENTANPMELMGCDFDPLSGELSRIGTVVEISKILDHEGEFTSVMGSPDSKGRLLALAMPLDDFEQKRFPILTRHGEVKPDGHGKTHGHPVPMPHEEQGGKRPADNMYSLQEHGQHRFGLVVDLDKCTGCSACAVACYAENNIPIVGKHEVTLGRELSWIRIEKHVFKESNFDRVQFLPVMCQQCDNAPCESVCPVFAASHTTDGLNAQIYNRCIGTRYCSNNCPYKVRRFNYFDYKRDKPGNQQLNPDVTVRSKGVMEKCTFCIQRIREVQNRRKVAGRELRDGEILPACVQTCPSGALSFGDFKRQEWKMSTLARDPRGYRLLDYVTNTRPGVVYLRKVTTVGPKSEEDHE